MRSERPKLLCEQENLIHDLGLPEEITSMLLQVLRGEKKNASFATNSPLPDILKTIFHVETEMGKVEQMEESMLEEIRERIGETLTEKFLNETAQESTHYIHSVTQRQLH